MFSSLGKSSSCPFVICSVAEVAVDRTKTFCPMAGCEGICDGLPGVAQPTVCQEVNENTFILLSRHNLRKPITGLGNFGIFSKKCWPSLAF